jgi:hypothetical protein
LQDFTLANSKRLAVPIYRTRYIVNDSWLKHDNSVHVVTMWTTLDWNMTIGLVSFFRRNLLSIQNAPLQAQNPPPQRTSDEATLLDSKCRPSQLRRFFLPPESKTYYEFIVGMVSSCGESNANVEIVLYPFEISTLHLYEKVGSGIIYAVYH